MGAAYYELKNHARAIDSFRAAIDAGGLLPAEASALEVNIAQLLIVDGRYVEGAELLEDWHAGGGTLTPAHLEMLIQAWVQATRYEKALPWAKHNFVQSFVKPDKQKC